MKFFKVLLLLGLLLYSKAHATGIHISTLRENIKTVRIERARNKEFIKGNFVKTANAIGNGKFFGLLDEFEPTFVYLVLNDSLYTEPFFVSQNDTSVYITVFKDLNLEIKGSKAQDEYIKAYNLSLEGIDTEIRSFFTGEYRTYYIKYNGQIPDSVNERFDEVRSQLREKRFEVIKDYIMQHPNSYVAMWKLLEEVETYGYKKKLAEGYTRFSDNLKKSAIGMMVSDKVHQAFVLSPDNPFPDLLVKDTGLQAIKLKEKLKGKYILIDFWFSYCGPCIDQFPVFQSLYQKYNRDQFNIVSISTDKKKDIQNWRKTIMKYHLPFIQYIDIDGTVSFSILSIVRFPSNFLLDTTGKILSKDITPTQLMKFLEKEL